MSSFRSPQGFSGPPIGKGTKGLLIAILACSLVFTLTERKLGFGVEDLIFTVQGVLGMELWRLFTFPFVETDAFGLLLSLVVLYFFGRFFEAQWGTRYYLRFFALSCVGAAILAIPLSFLVNLIAPFQDLGMAAGPGAAIDAMLVAMALTLPDSNVAFGFVLPMRARTIVYVLLGVQVVFGIMNGATALSITLGGMIMGYILVTGIWRPNRLQHKVKAWTLRKRRRGLYVVPPGNDKTLH